MDGLIISVKKNMDMELMTWKQHFLSIQTFLYFRKEWINT